MAVSTDPLRRDTLGVVAQLPTARIQAPVTNAALQLAEALRDVTPEARQAMDNIAEEKARKARAQAEKDAIQAGGAQLADAVREGKLKATQNPWYIQAYNREAAAIRAQDALQRLQVESSSWEESSDPQAFAAKWREEVGKLAEGYDGEDLAAGFSAAEGAVSSQVLQTNVAKNVARIQTERQQNLGALAVDALQSALRVRGGSLSPNEAWEALLPARQQWFATGGDAAGWNQIVKGAVTTTAYGAKDKFLLDLLKAPELASGPSEAGASERIGQGQGYLGGVSTIETIDPGPNPAAPAGAPQAPVQVARVEAPVRQGFELNLPVQGGRLTSGFGPRKRPMAGASANHGGVDLALPQGTPVQAQGVGKVVFAGRNGGHGNQVRVDYGNGVIASYSHLSEIAVKEGDFVGARQQVGAVGKTGTATGPHLHYELEVGGKKVDPLSFNGKVGGTFEGTPSADIPAPEALPGFPGQDRPFVPTSQQPANQYGRGVSIYGMPGVADEVESDRFRIGEAQQAAITEQMRTLDAQRTARGYQAQDYLLNKYGTGLLVGNVTRETIMSELSGQGYSAPEIAKALNLIRSGLTDSVGVAKAQIEARQADPGVAKSILDLQVKASTQGYTPGMEDSLGALVLSGDLSREDAAGIISGALSRTRQVEAEERADAREDRAEARLAAAGKVDSYSKLREQADIMAGFVVTKAVQLNPFREAQLRDPQVRAVWERAIADAMAAHLLANPGDFEGANLAGKNQAATLLRQQAGGARQGPPPAPAQGANPRR